MAGLKCIGVPPNSCNTILPPDGRVLCHYCRKTLRLQKEGK